MVRFAAMAVMLSAAAAWPAGFAWRTYVAHEQVQFGRAESDERAFWIACDDGKTLSAGGPSAAGQSEGPGAAAKIGGRSYAGHYIERGDSINFEVRIGPDEPFIRSLLRNRGFRLEEGGRAVSIPGKGAAKVVAPLLKACGSA